MSNNRPLLSLHRRILKDVGRSSVFKQTSLACPPATATLLENTWIQEPHPCVETLDKLASMTGFDRAAMNGWFAGRNYFAKRCFDFWQRQLIKSNARDAFHRSQPARNLPTINCGAPTSTSSSFSPFESSGEELEADHIDFSMLDNDVFDNEQAFNSSVTANALASNDHPGSNFNVATVNHETASAPLPTTTSINGPSMSQTTSNPSMTHNLSAIQLKPFDISLLNQYFYPDEPYPFPKEPHKLSKGKT